MTWIYLFSELQEKQSQWVGCFSSPGVATWVARNCLTSHPKRHNMGWTNSRSSRCQILASSSQVLFLDRTQVLPRSAQLTISTHQNKATHRGNRPGPPRAAPVRRRRPDTASSTPSYPWRPSGYPRTPRNDQDNRHRWRGTPPLGTASPGCSGNSWGHSLWCSSCCRETEAWSRCPVEWPSGWDRLPTRSRSRSDAAVSESTGKYIRVVSTTKVKHRLMGFAKLIFLNLTIKLDIVQQRNYRPLSNFVLENHHWREQNTTYTWYVLSQNMSTNTSIVIMFFWNFFYNFAWPLTRIPLYRGWSGLIRRVALLERDTFFQPHIEAIHNF